MNLIRTLDKRSIVFLYSSNKEFLNKIFNIVFIIASKSQISKNAFNEKCARLLCRKSQNIMEINLRRPE